MSNKMIFTCTWGSSDPERATLPFVAANVAATAGQEAVVLCTIDAVWLGTQDGTDGVAAPGTLRSGLVPLCRRRGGATGTARASPVDESAPGSG